MSQVASQVGLVANRSLALPEATQLASRQRDTFQLLVDTARAQSAVGLQTPGLVGQQAARTDQLLNAPLAPSPPQPAAPSLEQQKLEAFDARMNAPTLLQQARGTGFRPGTFEELDQLKRRSQLEFESRNSPANILRRFSLQQRIRDQRLSEAREAQSLDFARRREERSQRAEERTLLEATQQRRRHDQIDRRALKGIAEDFADDFRGFGVIRKNLGKAVKTFKELQEGVGADSLFDRTTAASRQRRGLGPLAKEEAIRIAMESLDVKDDVREDVRVLLGRLVTRGQKSPTFVEDVLIELASPPKETPAELSARGRDANVLTIRNLLKQGRFTEAFDFAASEVLPIKQEVMILFEEFAPKRFTTAFANLAVGEASNVFGAEGFDPTGDQRAAADTIKEARQKRRERQGVLLRN